MALHCFRDINDKDFTLQTDWMMNRSEVCLQWCAFYDVALLFLFYFFCMYNYLFAIQEMIAYPLSAFCICKLLPFSLYDTDNSSTFIKVTVWINYCFSMWKTGKDHCRLYYKLQSRKNNGIVDIWNDWELTQTGYYGSLFPPRDKQKVIVRLSDINSQCWEKLIEIVRCTCVYIYIYIYIHILSIGRKKEFTFLRCKLAILRKKSKICEIKNIFNVITSQLWEIQNCEIKSEACGVNLEFREKSKSCKI